MLVRRYNVVGGHKLLSMADLGTILRAIEAGETSVTDQLLPLVYMELRREAAWQINSERPGHTLQPTALVHEAYVRLVDRDDPQTWKSKGHFFRAAGEAMRRILIESARRKKTAKRGGGYLRVNVELDGLDKPRKDEDLIVLDEALTRLAKRDARAAKLVELRFFAGLTMQQAAKALDIALRTAERDWTFARAWLHKEVCGLADKME